MTVYSGFTNQTPEHLVLDAGAFYKNYDIATGLGTLLGATRGGGEFKAVPAVRAIEVDGVKGRAKGLNVIDAWDVSIVANMLEITTEILKAALTTGSVDTVTNVDYDIVTASNTIALSDYVDNITWVGRLSGSNKPVVIQIFNALNTEGLSLKTADKGEGVLPLTFAAHYDATNLDKVPFVIYYPKLSADVAAPTVAITPADEAAAVPANSNVVYTFSEAINPADVNPANFILMKASDGTIVPASLALNVARTVVTLDPTANLAAATAYVAIVTRNVKDANGNSLADNNANNFTTA